MLNKSKVKHYFSIFFFSAAFTMVGYSIARNLIEISAVSSANQSVCVLILMYHRVIDNNLGKDTISPCEFESDLKYLAENNYNTITMTQLINYVYDGEELPPNPIILSFDDGYFSTYKNVFPLLQKYNSKIVLSIIGKSTDDFSKVCDTNVKYAHLTWDQINEMAESGLVEIQNHSYNLHKVNKGRYGCYIMQNEPFEDYEQVLTKDITTLQSKIESAINFTPNTFTYPYGKYCNDTEVVIKKLGFKSTLSVKFGVNIVQKKNPESLYGLKRICRSHNQPISKLIKDGLETLKYRN